MSSPLEQSGATREPSEYAALSMDRHITGLWTQRSPLRDADVPYLYGKFYSASRFDSLIDGVNREITARLTTARRPGHSVWNANTFPALNSFYEYKRIVNGAEIIRLLADGQDTGIYDATANGKVQIMTKSVAGAKARFIGVNTALYMADGLENKKWLQPGPWTAQTGITTTTYTVGTIIIDSNGNLQYLGATKAGTVTNFTIVANSVTFTFAGANFNLAPAQSFIITGLSTGTYLNNVLLFAKSIIPSGGNFIVTANFIHAPVGLTADSGAVTSTDVGAVTVTSNTQPTWNVTVGGTTTDSISIWTNFGAPVFNWGPPNAPLRAPSVAINTPALSQIAFWQPIHTYGGLTRILDNNGYIQTSNPGGISGSTYPPFKAPPNALNDVRTTDGTVVWFLNLWLNGGGGAGPQRWQAGITPAFVGSTFGDVCIDINGNLQIVSAGAGATGGSEPTWSTTYGNTTADNGLTWTNLGPYQLFTAQGRKWGYAYHCIDGSVSTMSGLTDSSNAMTGAGANISGVYSADPQVDAVWIFGTLSNQGTPLLLASIPNVTGTGNWTFLDQYPDSILNPFFIGPQNGVNNGPPSGMTAPVYHMGCIWAIVNNTVVKSGGPTTIVGNGNTSFSPSDVFPIPEQPIRLFPGVSNAGPALFIWGTSNIYVILGAGTTNSPYQKPAKFFDGVGILSYDAICQIGSTYYAMTSKGEVASLDPGAGFIEFGFPIGDQFANVTTGAGGKTPFTGAPLGAIYSAATAYVTYADLGSGDKAVYVADGSAGWFRYSPIASPESGFIWSPRAVLECGSSAVQGIEVSPGVMRLLVGPPAGGSGNVSTVAGTNSVVNWVSGPKFNRGWQKGPITINGTPCTVVSVTSPTSLVVNVNLGTSGSVPFTVAGGGPIVFRDPNVVTDYCQGFNLSYPSYDVKGNIVLCQTGEVAEIAHIAIKSIATGARPDVGLLLGEIAATQMTPFDWLTVTSPDPPILPASQTTFSDRYSAEQNGVCPKCDNFQLAIDYGSQSFHDETLMFSVYGAKHAERRQQ